MSGMSTPYKFNRKFKWTSTVCMMQASTHTYAHFPVLNCTYPSYSTNKTEKCFCTASDDICGGGLGRMLYIPFQMPKLIWGTKFLMKWKIHHTQLSSSVLLDWHDMYIDLSGHCKSGKQIPFLSECRSWPFWGANWDSFSEHVPLWTDLSENHQCNNVNPIRTCVIQLQAIVLTLMDDLWWTQ